MKILSLAGENLASLTGAFTIDFAGGALGAAGLFAITGNTGAGKSTFIFVQTAYLWRLRFQLEDALCHIGNDTITVRIDSVFWYVSGHIPCKIIQHSAPPSSLVILINIPWSTNGLFITLFSLTYGDK